MKKLKNTKNLFIISFFGCFVLPGIIAMFAALNVFFDISGPVSDWVFNSGGYWILAVYQIIIILITIMLWLTLKLNDAEKITASDVVIGKKSNSKVKKVETIDIFGLAGSKRKEVKTPEKRVVEEIDYVKPVTKVASRNSTKKTTPTPVEKPITQVAQNTTTQKKMIPIKK